MYIVLSNIVLGMKYLDPFAELNKYYPVAHLALRERIKNVFIIIEMFRSHVWYYSPLVRIRVVLFAAADHVDAS